MTMGVREDRQEALFVTADELPKSQGHPFYVKLNALLREAGFDAWIEGRCRPYYEQRERRGRPSLNFRRACTSACCWWSSLGVRVNAASPGGAPDNLALQELLEHSVAGVGAGSLD